MKRSTEIKLRKLVERIIKEELNENGVEHEIVRVVDGKIREVITGTIDSIRIRFSAAVDNASKNNRKFNGRDPNTIEELLELLNYAQRSKERNNNPHTTYKLRSDVGD